MLGHMDCKVDFRQVVERWKPDGEREERDAKDGRPAAETPLQSKGPLMVGPC